MALQLRLPGSEKTWVLPADWTDAEFRFAWNVARKEDKELRMELAVEGGDPSTNVMVVMYPSKIPWFELVGATPTE